MWFLNIKLDTNCFVVCIKKTSLSLARMCNFSWRISQNSLVWHKMVIPKEKSSDFKPGAHTLTRFTRKSWTEFPCPVHVGCVCGRWAARRSVDLFTEDWGHKSLCPDVLGLSRRIYWAHTMLKYCAICIEFAQSYCTRWKLMMMCLTGSSNDVTCYVVTFL
jgi:hypothetical protein